MSEQIQWGCGCHFSAAALAETYGEHMLLVDGDDGLTENELDSDLG